MTPHRLPKCERHLGRISLLLALLVTVSQPLMSLFLNSATRNALQTADADTEVVNPPTDSISSLSFSSQADYLAAGSWDNSVRVSFFNSVLRQAAGGH